MPRITGVNFKQLRQVLQTALRDNSEISFYYHDKKRRGEVVDFGFGKQGAFITLDKQSEELGEDGAEYTKHPKSYSISKIDGLRVNQTVEVNPAVSAHLPDRPSPVTANV